MLGKKKLNGAIVMTFQPLHLLYCKSQLKEKQAEMDRLEKLAFHMVKR